MQTFYWDKIKKQQIMQSAKKFVYLVSVLCFWGGPELDRRCICDAVCGMGNRENNGNFFCWIDFSSSIHLSSHNRTATNIQDIIWLYVSVCVNGKDNEPVGGL